MKYLSALLLFSLIQTTSWGQGGLPDYFLDGKSVVLISNSPQARPAMEWQDIAEIIHPAILEAGGDPVSYYELEDVALSEEIQAGYAAAFNKRQIRSIIIFTRKSNGDLAFHIAPFTQNKNLVPSSGVWGIQATSLDLLVENLNNLGKTSKSNNLLVLEVPEFPLSESGIQGAKKFIAKNPLNLDVFKLGIPLSGSSGDAGLLMSYRYDMLGKTEQAILAEQASERAGLEQLLEAHYPYQYEFLTSIKGDAELVRERIQFILVRLEGKEGDLMKSMGLEIENPDEKTRIVVKYYIRLIIRDELYFGPVWDADPDWRKALSSFLDNLKINLP
ncbi:NTPase [Shivajiella indica]|uniref:NTPase n=1 Tax=Shivajiella indica TaxID=872115 RepID=A0ABW5B6E3_9BACT